MNKYYIYIHRKITDGYIFYIGKGCAKRAWNFNNRNPLWTNIAKKHGVDVEIVFDKLTEAFALELEKNLIAEFNLLGYSLANLSTGGESPVFSAAVRQKMSNSHTGLRQSKEAIEKTARFHRGRKRSAITCQKISKALTGRKVKPESAAKSRNTRTRTATKKSDNNIYCFKHESGLQFIGTRLQLCIAYNLTPSVIGKLFYINPRKTGKGWALGKGGTNDKEDN